MLTMRCPHQKLMLIIYIAPCTCYSIDALFIWAQKPAHWWGWASYRDPSARRGVGSRKAPLPATSCRQRRRNYTGGLVYLPWRCSSPTPPWEPIPGGREGAGSNATAFRRVHRCCHRHCCRSCSGSARCVLHVLDQMLHRLCPSSPPSKLICTAWKVRHGILSVRPVHGHLLDGSLWGDGSVGV
jgi:hypothetical protein